MPFLLMIFLVFVCLPEPTEGWPKPFWTDDEFGASVAFTLLVMLLPVLYGARISRRLASALEREPADQYRLSRRYERGRRRHQIALFGLFCLALAPLGWGWAVTQFWQWNGHLLPGAELVILCPFLASLVLSWYCFYEADRAVFRAAHRIFAIDPIAYAFLEADSAVAPPAQDFGSRTSYLVGQARQKLALVLIPISLLLVQKEMQRQFPAAWHDWQWFVNGAGLVFVLIVFALMPWIIRKVLGLRPLSHGPVRDRLLAAAQRLQFRCSDILEWNTNGAMANAMVVGVLPWLRYVVFTDRLLEEFTPAEVEAVLGHEIGHIKHHHMLYYLTFLTASMVVLGTLITGFVPMIAGAIADAATGPTSGWRDFPELLIGGHKYLELIPLAACLVAYILVVFGFLSRRCERQADIYGCRAVSCGRVACPGHDRATVLAADGHGLCRSGVFTFIRALEKVAVVNGLSRDKPGFLQSWQHSTIGRRVEFLNRLLVDPTLEPRFQRRVALVKWGLFLVLGVLLLILLSATDWSA